MIVVAITDKVILHFVFTRMLKSSSIMTCWSFTGIDCALACAAEALLRLKVRSEASLVQ